MDNEPACLCGADSDPSGVSPRFDIFCPKHNSSYGRKPMGIPTISHMNKDLSFTIVAAGHEQVERYNKAKSPTEYLAGEEAHEREGKG